MKSHAECLSPTISQNIKSDSFSFHLTDKFFIQCWGVPETCCDGINSLHYHGSNGRVYYYKDQNRGVAPAFFGKPLDEYAEGTVIRRTKDFWSVTEPGDVKDSIRNTCKFFTPLNPQPAFPWWLTW